ncbi:Retrovirus-related Pol polyprotein from transposon TNT 1-94 [Sesamum angolense]|uniref:Retrovirus-related Pol polyprotein from transposon TNT 1-94 n=1 Tax=Sesamum angolense TaxID=2727404 RepID=A0AAE2C2L4_9LAMI|nr:Retrovirus-related Pol polyprotein from transposon TNT 1-94 [Sesamum angolense]
MKNLKRGFLPMRHGIKLSKKKSPKTAEELKRMLDIPYASAVGSIQYVVQCTRPDVAYAFEHNKQISGMRRGGFVFKLNGGVVASKSSKQATTADSTTEVEYIATSKAAKEAVWMKNYIQELGVVRSIAEPVVIFCDNNGAIAQAKEPGSHYCSKYILRRFHLLREMVR